MKHNTTLVIFMMLVMVAFSLCLISYTRTNFFKRQLLIEQTKMDFIRVNTDASQMVFDSVYVSNTDTVRFYKNGKYIGKSITVTE